MPAQPFEPDTKVAYAAAHEPDFAFYLWEGRSPSPGQMFKNAVELENTLLACRKMSSAHISHVQKSKQQGEKGAWLSISTEDMISYIPDLFNQIEWEISSGFNRDYEEDFFYL